MKDQHNANDVPAVTLPTQAGKVLHKTEAKSTLLNKDEHKEYREIVGRVMHMTAWTRPDVANAVRNTSRYGQQPCKQHMKAARQIVDYLWQTPERGWYLKPDRRWKGFDKLFQFRIKGKSDSNYATCTDTRKSVTGYVVHFEGAPIAIKSVMQKIIALSATEAELIALVQCIQEMFYAKKVIESMGLIVEVPMIVQCDNKGVVDLVNGHSIGGNTKHIDVRILHVRDHKDKGLIKVEWIPTATNEADVSTKNTMQADYNKHIKCYVGRDKYNRHPLSREANGVKKRVIPKQD